MHSLTEKLQFLAQFVRHPKMIGSIIPSGRPLIDALLSEVDWGRARLIVEYGPGVGTFTRPMLDRMAPDARLIAIDTNRRFVRHLRKRIADPRFEAVAGSAADVKAILAERGHAGADYVLSGLPFSTLPDGVGAAIVAETREVLAQEGAFLVYQYSRFVERLLGAQFRRIASRRIWGNIPPCLIFVARA